MRLVLSLLAGLVGAFLTSHLLARLFPQSISKLPLLSGGGSLLVTIGILLAFIESPWYTNPGQQALVSATVIGTGLGMVVYQLLYFGFLWAEQTERAFTKKHQHKILRFIEVIPGALTWLVITSPVWLALKLPFFVAYLVLLADLYWFFTAFRIAILVIIGYRRMRRAEATDWLTRLKEDFPSPWQPLYHLAVIPTFKEELPILETTFAALAASDFPRERIFVALGLEQRDGERGQDVARSIMTKYGAAFGGIWITVHPDGLPGEVRGPATNRNFALRNALKEFAKRNIPYQEVLVTTLDADFAVHPHFLSGVTHAYLSTPAEVRLKRSFTGVFLYNNNYWQTATPMRIMASGTAFWQLSEMVWSDKYINFASMTINLATLVDLDFWIPDRVNDDAGFYWKAYYHFQGDYKVIPHYLPISADAVQDASLVKSLQNQYLQLKRWAYGVEHIPFFVKSYFTHTSMPFWDKADKLLFIFWIYVKWGTLVFLITFGGLLIPLVSPEFRQSVVSYNLNTLASWLLTAAFFGLFSTAIVSEKVVPPRPKEWNIIWRIWSYIQWILLPLVLVTIASVPALDAQTRLMFGKYMEFRVTTKFRRPPTIAKETIA